MMFKVEITDYSSYANDKNYRMKSYCGNYSDVYDAIIRKTAKLTERYASDILIDFEFFIFKNVQEEIPFSKIFMFRESGVTSKNPEEITEQDLRDRDYLQKWLLTYDPAAQDNDGTPRMEWKRVNLAKKCY